MSHAEQPDLDFGTTAAATTTAAAAPAKSLTFHTSEHSPEAAPARTPAAAAPPIADTPRTPPEADMRNLGTPTAATTFPPAAPPAAPADAPAAPTAGPRPQPQPTSTPAAGPRLHPTSAPTATPATPAAGPRPHPASTPTDAPATPAAGPRGLHPTSAPTATPATPATPAAEPRPHPTSTPTAAPTAGPRLHPTATPAAEPRPHPASTPTDARAATTTTEKAGAAPSSPVEITCREERLDITTEWHTLGTAKLRKYVTTEQVERRVPVVRERVRVERTPVSDAERAALTEKEIAEAVEEVTLREERAVVRKHLAPIERVRLVVERYTTEEVIRDELRREHVEVHDTTATQPPASPSATPPTGSTPPATPPHSSPLRPLV
ncbi:YsnF/AvaK domain-containing protein [Kitasatospora sp. NPDC093102]|uniref:YsnF/AvaK domain-containing protein n=1 Tax=Kitasatospora sp. NPDC093102 TaxID=3155069 RepID=UPI0034369319